MRTGNDLSYNKALYVKKYLQKQYPNYQVKIIDIKGQHIKINNELFHYQYYYILDEINVKLTKVNLKSNRGTLKAKNPKKILFTLAAAGMVSLFTPNVNINEAPFQKKEIQIEQVEPKVLDISEDLNNEKVEKEPEKEIFSSVDVINFDNLEFKNEYNMQKKDETKKVLGDVISYYANRNGLDSNLLIALFTQERSNDLSDSNIGQLTQAICGEKIIAPVFQDGKVVGEDKIFVLPPCYDDYPIEDLETMGNYPKFSEEEKEKIQTAIILQKNGYEIYRFKDTKTNQNLNLKVAIAYLTYLINMQNDLVKGIASYNMGYNRINNDVTPKMILNGEIKDANDPNYLTNIFEYLSEEERINGFTIYYENGQVIHYEIKVQVNEKKVGRSL